MKPICNMVQNTALFRYQQSCRNPCSGSDASGRHRKSGFKGQFHRDLTDVSSNHSTAGRCIIPCHGEQRRHVQTIRQVRRDNCLAQKSTVRNTNSDTRMSADELAMLIDADKASVRHLYWI